jgi:hypothetical protein
MRRSTLIKKYVLGQFYVEGTWAGYYYPANDNLKSEDVYFVVDYFSQDMSSLKIDGKGFTKKGDVRATWESKAAQISQDGGRMIFVVDCTIPKSGTRCDAITDFQLTKVEGAEWSNFLTGQSTNVTKNRILSQPLIVRQKKISDARLNDVAALQEAHALYQKEKNVLPFINQ